jgi:hypothetical protein
VNQTEDQTGEEESPEDPIIEAIEIIFSHCEGG